MTIEVMEWLSQLLDIAFARDPNARLIDAIAVNAVYFASLYAVFPGAVWFLVRNSGLANLANSRAIAKDQVVREIFSSILSIAMFCVVSAIIFLALRAGALRVTGTVSAVRCVIEIFALALWNEVHFYATHRLLHVPFLYKHVHYVHHRSVVVTPFAGWRFHWVEALLLGAVMPLAMLVHTFSVWSLIIFPVWSLFWNVVGHSNWRPEKLTWWKSVSARHALHHSNMRFNFGFAFPYLDRWLRTARDPE